MEAKFRECNLTALREVHCQIWAVKESKCWLSFHFNYLLVVSIGMLVVGILILLQWLELSLDEDIPASLLLLSRTLYMRQTTVDEQLKVTIGSLPERLVSVHLFHNWLNVQPPVPVKNYSRSVFCLWSFKKILWWEIAAVALHFFWVETPKSKKQTKDLETHTKISPTLYVNLKTMLNINQLVSFHPSEALFS